jgi:hypothetical protein
VGGGLRKGRSIDQWYVHWHDEAVLLSLGWKDSVLDVRSDELVLRDCVRRLRASGDKLDDVLMGKFGRFIVRVNLDHEVVSIFVDGPRFGRDRCQSAAIWANRAQRADVIELALRHER